MGGSDTNGSSSAGSISGNGRYVSFQSNATNLVTGDGNGSPDVFVHDAHATGSVILCEPGVASVVACPCGNPPAGSGRGCDNSASTGGARLAASGIAYLSSDSLSFTADGELGYALSTLFEGTTPVPAGSVYGQGVRCVGGQLRRLYSRSASAGSLTFPAANEPSISARSAARGLQIQPGVPTFFFVAYRDPAVHVGCPAGSTFNATTASEILWWP
jgi:hypothetical protein